MSTEKPVSASINVTMVASGPAVLCMPGPDNDFDDSIEDNLVEFFVFFAVQNPCSTVSEFAWSALGNWWKMTAASSIMLLRSQMLAIKLNAFGVLKCFAVKLGCQIQIDFLKCVSAFLGIFHMSIAGRTMKIVSW